ncbi:MAG: phospho-N-acetylmuramoyl-pentapeptide-transferase [Patescibacteria group bacterium]|nr:phospho-N-acetylmuramoyl-pentapeptide-transferase [Patescibacteria group bacterium]
MINWEILRIFILTVSATIIGVIWAPLLTNFLYKNRLGKKIRQSKDSPIYSQMHAVKAGTPTMGGILIWGTTAGLALILWLLSKFTHWQIFDQLNFINRSETWLPLAGLIFAAIIGLVDDLLNIRGQGANGGGLRMRYKWILYGLIGLVGALWFYFKLDWSIVHVPLIGNFEIGWWFIPFFMLVVAATSHSVNLTDGLDGLAGGILLTSFGAYGVISFMQGRFDLAVLCGIIIGALLAFLWFNIYPARFFMGDTGSMSLGTTLALIALFTNESLLLVIIGMIFVSESLSVIIQIISRKIRHKKIFISAPVHHHFEAKGWPEPKVVMRFWLISGVGAVLGIILFLIDKTF